jgi:hypothetical protein
MPRAISARSHFERSPRAVEQHQRGEGVHARLVAHGMRRESDHESNGFVTQLFANHPFAARGFVPFVEQQVERAQYTFQPHRHLFLARNRKWHLQITNSLPRPNQPLINGDFGREERLGDFRRAEPAKRLQRERRLRLFRQRGMAARKHQPQSIVGKLGVIQFRGLRLIAPAFDKRDHLRLLLMERLLPTDDIQSQVFRGLRQPRRGIFRHSIVRPGFQGSDERFLHHVLRELQPLHPENRRQNRDHLARFVPEEMVRQPRDFRG